MTSRERSQGYVEDTTYPDRFYPELAPAWLRYVLALGGVAAPPIDGPFRYLELGCGFARTSVLNAAAYPRAEFHACDLLPAHIEQAQKRASALGVSNLALYEATFRELAARKLPSFDFIVLHGVYSWVKREVRDDILTLIEQTLAPSGVVYVSYNCTPGWSVEAPLRTLLYELAAAEQGSAGERAVAASRALRALAHDGFKYFRDHAFAIAAAELLAEQAGDYLAHEFLNEAWEVYDSLSVADDFARAGAAYAGSATLAYNHPLLVMDGKAAASIAKLPPRLRQQATDFAVNQRFRRDVFVRSPRALEPAALLENLDALAIGCTGDPAELPTHAPIPRGKLTFTEEFVASLRAQLEPGAVRLGEAVRELGRRGGRPQEIRQNLLYMTAAGQLWPFASDAARGREPFVGKARSAAVTAALEQIVASSSPGYVPCEEAGNGVLVEVSEAERALAFLAAPRGEPDARMRRLGLIV